MSSIESYFLILSFAFTFSILFYFTQHPDFMTELLGETGNLLLYGIHRIRITAHFGIKMTELQIRSLFFDYYSMEEWQKIQQQKDQNLYQLHQNTRTIHNTYLKKGHHFKILK